jgi:aldehyde dehydrogenase (NAD+)
MTRYQHWINGAESPPASGSYLTSTTPGTDSVVCEVANGSAPDVDAAVAAASRGLARWRSRKPGERGRVLAAIADEIRRNKDRLAQIESAESGKPDWQSPMEIDGAAAYFDFYAGLANLPVGEIIDLGPGLHGYTVREPFGVVGVITPWNAPLNQAARAIAPALLAGNTVVAKPSEFTSATTLELACLATSAGLLDGVLNVVTGTGEDVGALLGAHPRVRKVAFTGSVRAGQAISHIAAERILPLTLELGGKSANIVFADADRGAAVRGAITAFVGNAGPSVHRRQPTAGALVDPRRVRRGARRRATTGPARSDLWPADHESAVRQGAVLFRGRPTGRRRTGRRRRPHRRGLAD